MSDIGTVLVGLIASVILGVVNYWKELIIIGLIFGILRWMNLVLQHQQIMIQLLKQMTEPPEAARPTEQIMPDGSKKFIRMAVSIQLLHLKATFYD